MGEVQAQNVNNITIDYSEIKDEVYSEKILLPKVNEWAKGLKFQMIYNEGLKELKNELKRTLACNFQKCPFKIIFKSEKDKNEFKVDEKLSNKYNKHSKSFYF